MKQIYLKNREDIKKLNGLTIKDVSFYNNVSESAPHLAITFTDGSFIYIGIEENYREELLFVDKTPVPIKNYIMPPGHVFDRKFIYRKNVEELIRLGIVEPDDEYAKSRVEDNERLKEEREYQQYLELKKKYENK